MIGSLRRKFVAVSMGLVTLVLLLVLLGIVLYYAGSLRQESYRSLDMALSRPEGDRAPRFELGKPMPEGFNTTPTFLVTLRDGRGYTLSGSDYIDVDEESLPEILSAVEASGQDRGELGSFGLRFVKRAGKEGTRIAFTALSIDRSRILSVLSLTGAVVAAALLVFFALSLLLSRWALRPVEKAWQQQRQFVSNASHELKTPLTVILASMSILKRHPEETVQAQMTWIGNAEEEALRMKGLVDGLLFLAKGDDTAQKPESLPLDLSDLCSTMALTFEPVVFEKGLSLSAEIDEGITLEGNEAQLKQLVSILLDNAVKYSKPAGGILFSLRREQGRAALSVYNEGKAPAPEELDRLFDRFYRADPARSTPGYGLGLSIARMIAENHRGKISAQAAEGGIRFTVLLPLS